MSLAAQIEEYKPETVKDTLERVLSDFDPITRAISLQIVEAESHFRNICNTEGCRYGIGPAMFVQSTFDEQCTGHIWNVEDNLRCMAQLIEKEEYWRWEQSMDVWLYKLPTEIRDYVKVRCECVSYARSQGLNIPLEIIPNAPPAVGRLAVFSYKEIRHVAIIIRFNENGFTVKESNFQKCKISKRFVEWTDQALVGFWADSEAK